MCWYCIDRGYGYVVIGGVCIDLLEFCFDFDWCIEIYFGWGIGVFIGG